MRGLKYSQSLVGGQYEVTCRITKAAAVNENYQNYHLCIITYRRLWQRRSGISHQIWGVYWLYGNGLRRSRSSVKQQPQLSHASSSSFQFPFHPFISFRLIPRISFFFPSLPFLLCFTLAAVILISIIHLATRSTSSAIIASHISALSFAECALPPRARGRKHR